MKKTVANIFDNVFLSIEADSQNRWIYNEWSGYLTMHNVKTGAVAYLSAVRESGYSCVLNDNSLVLGSWAHSLDWVKHEWQFLAAQAGIKYFALVISPESMTEASAFSFSDVVTTFEVKVFKYKANAEDWLRLHSL